MNDRIIFLDVDGVLNNGAWAMQMYDKGAALHEYLEKNLCGRGRLAEGRS